MKPKDKARGLVDRMWCIKSEMFGMPLEPLTVNEAKQCALIAVDELIKNGDDRHIEYWQEVKNEIEKL